jgi:DNA-binding transcriptional ArsR family regulator
MANNSPSLDEVFHSLSDPTRRTVLEKLINGTANVSQLAQGFPISLPYFLQHLSVLESCNLVHSSKKGRVRPFVVPIFYPLPNIPTHVIQIPFITLLLA